MHMVLWKEQDWGMCKSDVAHVVLEVTARGLKIVFGFKSLDN